MAAARTMTDSHIVSLTLYHLSDMKYKDRRQPGPDQPVEFLEFRPTLVPSLLVNKLWAEEGTSILWKRYPHLPVLRGMSLARRQWYANKVERLFVSESTSKGEDLTFLAGLHWPMLKIVEVEADWKEHGKSFGSMLHADLEHLEFSGVQSSGSQYFATAVLPALIAPCPNLRTVCIGPDTISRDDPVHNQDLIDAIDIAPAIQDIRIMNANFLGKNLLFGRLSQRPGLEALEIDLDPGLQLLPIFTNANMLPPPFSSLKRLHVVCYPELALVLPLHLAHIEVLHLDVARVPDQAFQDSDLTILDDLLGVISKCQTLQTLRINIFQLSAKFPSALSYPILSGMPLVELASGCPKLQDISLLAAEPAAIDGSRVSSLQFEAFCKRLSCIRNLSLKLHPQTAIDLESTALQSLGRHCSLLEVLRLRIALQLPSLPTLNDILLTTSKPSRVPSSTKVKTDTALSRPSIAINGHHRGVSLDTEYYLGSTFPNRPLLPHLTHLAFARPQTVLSIASDTYTFSSASQSSLSIDPSIEEDLVRLWAQPLVAHFPELEILEAWSDWTGHDNESLNYFLPLEEELASTWEFLSGVEQDLWDDGDDNQGSLHEIREQDQNTNRRPSFDSLDSGNDWERASLVNEFHAGLDLNNDDLLSAYDEESEGMSTPRRPVESCE